MREADGLVLLSTSQYGPGAACITLNRPAQRNALDWATIRQLNEIVARLDAESSIQLVLIRGSGGNLSAGGDLKGYMELYTDRDQFRQFLEDFYKLLDSMERSSKLFLTVVEGYCVAGGLELLLASDVVIAASTAQIGDGHLNFGQLPGAGGSQRLPRVIGPMRARYMIATGEMIDAAEAERIGLVSKVVAEAELDGFLETFVQRLLSHSPLSLKGMKYLVNEGLRTDLESGLRMEIEYVLDYATTASDAQEGLRAFQEKRKARFTGS